jgi:hypothetical protein
MISNVREPAGIGEVAVSGYHEHHLYFTKRGLEREGTVDISKEEAIGLLKKARDEKTIVQAVYRNQAWVNVGVKGTIFVLDDQQVIVRHADDVQSFLHFDLKVITSFKYGDRREFSGNSTIEKESTSVLSLNYPDGSHVLLFDLSTNND